MHTETRSESGEDHLSMMTWGNLVPDIIRYFLHHPALREYAKLLSQLNHHWCKAVEENVHGWTVVLQGGKPLPEIPERFGQIWKRLSVVTVGNADLHELSPAHSVTSLKVRSAGPGSLGLKCLRSMKRLTNLDLSGCREISDLGLSGIQNAIDLRSLTLTCSKISDPRMNWLIPLKNLEDLDLGGCRDVSDISMKNIGQLIHLHRLVLYGTQVTDAGIEHLADLRELQELSLAACSAVSNISLNSLILLNKLKTLDLFGTKVDPWGKTQLRSTLHEAFKNIDVRF